MKHTPVLLKEVLDILKPKPGEFFVDATFGGGGHSLAILKKVLPKGRVFAVDLDPEAVKNAPAKNGLVVEQGNYADLPSIISLHGFPKADGVIADVGFSSINLESGRGFTFQKNEPLLMTYDPKAIPVKTLLIQLNEDQLADIIYKYGEERFSRRIAKAIKEMQRKKPIETTKDLVDAIVSAVPPKYRREKIHPATRTFQALRIYANKELDNLKTFLESLPLIVKSGGRAAVITFHSLEDRIVKNYFKNYEKVGKAKILTKKPIVPSREEINQNPRARSAKLRAIQLK